MNQTVLNSGQFRRNRAVNAAAAVSLLDDRPVKDTQRRAWWPLATIVLGGVLTLVWDGFLFWQFAKVVILWLGLDA